MRFRFGLFELDGDTLDLRRQGQPVHLQAQPKQVLACLVGNAGRIVTREELQKRIWGDQTFVDFDRGLNFCIAQIRSTLGDDAASPTYLRTIPRQGYQFIAPAERIDASGCPGEAPGPASPPTGSAHGARKRQGRTPTFVYLTALLLLASAAGVLLRLTAAPQSAPVVAVVRFDNETGDASFTRFSDALTDTFVERLTTLSAGRYAVIGNAQVLRGPRDRRDLVAIASSLRASYVILGQVQAYGGQTRILAHLIHMPEQTHVSVTRLDRHVTNPLDVEAEVAQAIAQKFSSPLAARDTSPVNEKH
ncbi:MAG TPA: winged helix-turn-helix domain-containing protein [Terriglobales bacterium]|nr:winged helix-turn-helix domain-containing protein [Terriglobales bacterium]